MKILAVAAAALVAACGSVAGVDRPRSEITAFTNASWYSGDGFSRRTAWVVNGRFVPVDASQRPDRTIDLAGAYIVPAYGDAHNHRIDGPWSARETAASLVREGVLFVSNPTNIAEFTQRIDADDLWPLEVQFAHGAITGERGHPVQLYEDRLRVSYFPEHIGPRPRGWFAGRAYYEVTREADIDAVWISVRSSRPDFIKMVFSYSEDFHQNLSDPSPFVRRGLNPALGREITARARAAGLRSSAHVETVTDFRAALDAGVDEIAHLPGYYLHGREDEIRAQLTIDDAHRAAASGVVVVTMTSISARIMRDPVLQELVRAHQSRNLTLLREVGARLVIGSDSPTGGVAEEVEYLANLNVFSNAELLHLLSSATPQWISPGQDVGSLMIGSEATFLVLGANPLTEISNAFSIQRVFKNGLEVDLDGV